jgi:predicted patatin/cPLA2 family phospholipase
MVAELTFLRTKPKVFYDIISLFEKINSANKNIPKFERVAIIEPYVLQNLSNALKQILNAISAKERTFEYLQKSITELENSREFFMFFSQKKELNYNQNFTLSVNLLYESILKQMYGWIRKQKIK